MLIFLFPIIVSFLISQTIVSSSDLIEFDNKFYIANSYKPYSGQLVDYYNNGLVQLHGSLDKGYRVGDWVEFGRDGLINSKLSYKRDKMTKIYFDSFGHEIKRSFYSNNVLDSTINLIKKIDVISVEVATSKSIIEDIKNEKLEISGNVIVEEINESKISKNVIIDEIKNGEYTIQYTSGRYLVENYREGVLHGPHIVYHKNGFKSIDRLFVHGNLERITSEYDEFGMLVSKYHEYLSKDNLLVKNGDYVSFHPNGKIFEEGTMISGYRYGMWNEYTDRSVKNREIYYDVDPLSLNQEYIKTNITSYYNNGNKNSEYNVHTYTRCLYGDQECSTFSGDKINSEIKNGKFKSYYSDGSLELEGNYLNGKKTGRWLEYYLSGEIRSITEFVEEIGYYISYHENYPKRIHQIGHYKNEHKNGEWKEYNINFEISRVYFMDEDYIDINYPYTVYYQSSDFDNEEDYKKQIKFEFYCSGTPEDFIFHGSFKKYFSNNQLEIIGIYKDDNEFGTWNYYFPDGSLKADKTLDEYGTGNYKAYYISGELKNAGRYVNNLKEGKWIYYHKNNLKEWVIFYLHDKINPNQLSSHWYDTGYKKSEGYLSEFENEIIWDDKYIEYYENGIIYQEGYYNRGMKSGRWIEYYNNRVRKSSGDYKDDQQVGEWEYYSKDGIVIERKSFN